MSYTNTTGAEQTVYLSATGDSFISQLKVTVPTATYSTSFGFAAKLDDVRSKILKVTATNGTDTKSDSIAISSITDIDMSGEATAEFAITLTDIPDGVTITNMEIE